MGVWIWKEELSLKMMNKFIFIRMEMEIYGLIFKAKICKK